MLSTNPPKGTQDRYPEEYQIRKYIFDTWRKVCERFGYQEYLGPLVENADIRRAKSGEDVGGSELTLITNREGKISDLALRPEMTPSVTRMVSKKFNELPKPIRYFSIANFYRNERPQRGRNREFWQLNIDMFSSGMTYFAEDLEILQTAIAIMEEFKAPKGSWNLLINHREITEYILDYMVKVAEAQKVELVRLMDKREKLDEKDFRQMFLDFGLNDKQIDVIVQYMNCDSLETLVKIFPEITKSSGYSYLSKTLELAELAGISEYIKYQASLIRGFDYYNGMVFEIFDNHPDNRRALFGGGRYNGLSSIFGVKDEINAIGYAPGDETLKLFLESRGLIPKILEKTKIKMMYIPILNEELYPEILKLAGIMRKERNIILGISSQGFGKAMKYADKNNFDFIIIYGEEEKKKGVYKVKDMKTGKQRDYTFAEKDFERFCSKKLNK